MKRGVLVGIFAAAVAVAGLAFPAGGGRTALAAGCNGQPCLRVDAIAGGGVDESASVSGTFSVDVVAENTGGDIGSFNFTLLYNVSVFSAGVPSTAGLSSSGLDCSLPASSGDLPEDDASSDHDPATGDAFISCFTFGDAYANDGPIARIPFTVVGSGSSALSLFNVQVSDRPGEVLVTCGYGDITAGVCRNASVSRGGAPPPPPPPGADACTVTVALDGETVRCSDGTHLRFIGVGSPLGADPGAAWATAVTQWFLAGKTVTIEKDVNAFDEFGQRYGYAHVIGTDGNDYNISALLIFVGMARHFPDGVNVKHAGWLGAAEVWARTACWNMWDGGNPWAPESGCL